MQWWLTFMERAYFFQLSCTSLTQAVGTGNATTAEIPEPLEATCPTFIWQVDIFWEFLMPLIRLLLLHHILPDNR